MIKANSIGQYNKWKDWKSGLIKNEDMYILAQTYYNDITGLLFKLGKRKEDLSDNQIFNLVADNIKMK